MIQIIPSILTDNPDELRELINVSEQAVERAHIDIIDGVFANNKTILPEAVADVQSDLFFDYHLMVKEPINWIEKSIRGYADRILGQVEMMESQEKFVLEVITREYKVGLGIDLDTPVSAINDEVLKDLDVVLVMSVAAGFGGQEFDKSALDKIIELDKMRSENDYKYAICDDGGVSLENIDDTHFLGADEVSIGRSLFEGNLVENVEKFKKAAHRVKLLE